MIFHSSNTSPYYNLALEEFLLRHTHEDHFLIWESSPAIIYGKFQNPWREIHVDYALKQKHLLVRRITGGGCVYEGPGNINYSFIGSGDFEDRGKNLLKIKKAFEKLGIALEINDRFDLILKYKQNAFKVSGNAFKNTRGRWIHHGSLLLKADINGIWDYLTRDTGNIRSKSIESTRSPVTNILDIYSGVTQAEVTSTLIKEMHSIGQYGSVVSEINDENITRYEQDLRCDDWIYGQTPKFSIEGNLPVKLGGHPVFLHMEKGRFQSIEVIGNKEIQSRLENTFLGKYYTQQWEAELDKIP
tara:strand:+ start:384183 stop:385085 length:903 start_codon:yes stop_codon:yes gene_type:complete